MDCLQEHLHLEWIYQTEKTEKQEPQQADVTGNTAAPVPAGTGRA